MRVDLHVHSNYSTRPSQWFLQKIGCPESFTAPLQLYRIAKQRGMTHVTITDHNRIEGALEIAHLPDAFISEEVTSYFPEDRCKVHVLIYHIDEKQHAEIQHLRQNLFDLVAYLQKAHIVHALAHPLYSVNDRLTLEHFEQCLLLFKNFELNGDFNHQSNQILRQLLADLEAKDIEVLSEKHRIVPHFGDPWQKNLVGGSDDHSSLNIARTYTEAADADSVESFLNAIQQNQVQVVHRHPPSPLALAHNLYSIAYQFYRHKLGLGNYVPKDFLLRFIDSALRSCDEQEAGFFSKLHLLWKYGRRRKMMGGVPDTLIGMLRKESAKLISDYPEIFALSKKGKLPNAEKQWFDFVNKMSNRVVLQFVNHLTDNFSGANIFDIFYTAGSFGGCYTLLAPYFVAFAHYNKQRQFAEKVRANFAKSVLPRTTSASSENIAIFTDTFYEVNEVAQNLQQQVQAALQNHKKLTVITCDTKKRSGRSGIKNFEPIGVYEISAYPEQKLFYPPFMEMLQYCYAQKFTRIHAATAGPLGMAALIIARLLKLPITGTYHTSLPQYAQWIFGDFAMEELAWRYSIWFYSQMALIYVPSRNNANELREKGIPAQKIMLFPKFTDIERFHPAKRNGLLQSRYRIKERIKLLYVGRVSKEKNLALLADVFKQHHKDLRGTHLIIVGDGPYLPELRQKLAGTPATFTGYLEGEDLADIYAACDIFIYPSIMDSYGRVVLEAQASGLPVIVSDRGGPQEVVLPGQTGLIIKGNESASLQQALRQLIEDPALAKKMGRNARQYIEERFFDGAFHQIWDMYTTDLPHRAALFSKAV